MLTNYIKLAWRNIRRHPLHSFINIIGLSAGIAFSFLVGAYAWTEWKVDRQLKNSSRQYILQSKWKDPHLGIDLTTPGPLAKALKQRYPGLVANYYRWMGIPYVLTADNKPFRDNLQFGDSSLISMYGFTLLHGDPGRVFNDPFSAVITDEKARKYFGRTDVIGRSLTLANPSGVQRNFTITGVLRSPGVNSVTHLHDGADNQVYLSVAAAKFFGFEMDSWNVAGDVSYVELQKGVGPKDLAGPIHYLLAQNTSPLIRSNLDVTLIPLTEYHLQKGMTRKALFTLSISVVFILLMAIVNFINISISLSSSRMREIGIRKVLGGSRSQLIGQHLAEFTTIVLLSALFSLTIYSIVRPWFITWLNKDIPSLRGFPLYFALIPIGLIGLVTLAAGTYPAFVLSSIRAVESLKGKLRTTGEKLLLRRSLVCIQFAIASIVLIAAFVVSGQLSFLFSQDLGYGKDYIITAMVPRDNSLAGISHMEMVRKEMAALPEVREATLSYEIPNGQGAADLSFYPAGADSSRAVAALGLRVDEHYLATYEIPLLAGSFYTKGGVDADSSKIVINETAALALGYLHPAEAIGQRLQWRSGGGQAATGNTLLTIGGVTKDFHFGSMGETIRPIGFVPLNFFKKFRYLSFKIRSGDISRSLADLQHKWATLIPAAPFEYSFMDDTLRTMYKLEIQLKKACDLAVVLAFIIVLLGVLGLVSVSLQKRTKEIGIRKVLGASVPEIIGLFWKEFLPLVSLAACIAAPVAWWILRTWLNDYAYRISLTATPFLFAIGLLGITIALLIAIRTARTALASPVDSLRTE